MSRAERRRGQRVGIKRQVIREFMSPRIKAVLNIIIPQAHRINKLFLVTHILCILLADKVKFHDFNLDVFILIETTMKFNSHQQFELIESSSKYFW